MPRSSRQIRRSASPEAGGKKGGPWEASPGTILNAGLLLLAGLAVVSGAVAVFWFRDAALGWAEATLYLGWAPLAVFALAVLATLRWRPKLLLRRWRWWVAGASALAILLGGMSFFYLGDGYLFDTGLSGRWGVQVVGPLLPFGALKLAALALLTPLLLYPRPIGPLVLTGAAVVGHWLSRGTAYFFMALAFPVYWIPACLASLLAVLRRYRQRHSAGDETADSPPQYDDPSDVPWGNLVTADAPSEDWNTPANEGDEDDESPMAPVIQRPAVPSQDFEVDERRPLTPVRKSGWQLPTMDLLAPPEPKETSEAPLREMAQSIEGALAEHGVAVEVKDIKAGPRIVRFGLVPGWVPRRGNESDSSKKSGGGQPGLERSRVKVQSILSREKDLALALSTPYLRIEAPVPGEALVGLEVPTPTPTKVSLRGVMDNPVFQKVAAKDGLPVALGEDTGGNPVVTDLASLPHLLIAGATGSGKSVCINSLVASLLFSKPPDQMRLLMVDPKRVELTPFNGIPHLIAPVIVDAEQVNDALRGLMREMFRRYRQMEEIGTRNIAGFNAKVAENEKMAYLVLIVDELADLMMVAGFEVEQNLVRLAQLGRATGIHLVLATQRPSVNVVTGLLKANIAARVAFAVASQVDSRVILDAVGAEKLLGRGDMLLLNSDSPKPRRVQGNLVTDEEIDRLVEFWLNQKGPPLPVISIDDVDELSEEEDAPDDDLVDKARELALRNPHLSSSLLERRLKVGGHRAAQIIDVLVDEGLVIAR